MGKNINNLTDLDDISKNIIYCLSLDSRMPVSNIAKLVKDSRRIVEGRIKRLYKQKIIHPTIKINYHNATGVFVRLIKFDPKIAEYLKSIPWVVEVKETLGYYDLFFIVLTKNLEKLNSVLIKLDDIFHSSFANLDIIYNLSEKFFGYKRLSNLSLPVKIKEELNEEQIKFSKQEKEILGYLRNEPLISYKSLINKAGKSYLTIKKTINSLKEKGMLFSAKLNSEKVNAEINEVFLKVKVSKRKEFEEDIKNNKNIIRIISGRGRWDYILSIFSESTSDFIDSTREIRSKYKDNLLDFNILISKNV